MNVPDLHDLEISGVHTWRGDPHALASAAAAAKLRFLLAELKGVSSKVELLAALAKGLQLPAHFGGNWDALEDCLTDFSWHQAAGYVLLLHGADGLAQRCPDDYGVLIDVLGACAQYWRERWRERAMPFFAVAIDPRANLALPLLYNERSL